MPASVAREESLKTLSQIKLKLKLVTGKTSATIHSFNGMSLKMFEKVITLKFHEQ